MLTAEELESISRSFDESLCSRLWGLSPASVSLPWLASAVDAITFAYSAARSVIYQLKLDNGDSLSSWYSGDSLKVLGICNCMSADIDGLFLRHLNLRIAITLLRGTPSKEQIHDARDLLADWESEGGFGHLESATEGLIRVLDASIGMQAQPGKVSPVERVVSRTIRAVGFLTSFVARVVSSALRSSLRSVVSVSIPEEFPWDHPVRAIESAIIVEPPGGDDEDDVNAWVLLKELEDAEASMKELYDMDACVRHVLKTIDDVVASGGGRETPAMLRESVFGLEKAAKALSQGLSRLREEANDLTLIVTILRKETDEFLKEIRGH